MISSFQGIYRCLLGPQDARISSTSRVSDINAMKPQSLCRALRQSLQRKWHRIFVNTVGDRVGFQWQIRYV